MAAALRARSTAAYLVSDVMREHGFVNVETPFLTRSTPRAPATSWSRSGCGPVTGMRCRSPRSCSSSC